MGWLHVFWDLELGGNSGEHIVVIYEEIDEDTVYPVTAYVVED